MSYSVSGSGHGADGEKAKAAFAAFVAALDKATGEGGSPFEGSITGSEPEAEGKGYSSFGLTAASARAGALEAEGGTAT